MFRRWLPESSDGSAPENWRIVSKQQYAQQAKRRRAEWSADLAHRHSGASHV
jgi:hypothetical protein